MIAVRRSNERGLTKEGWLTSRHTFSFADYYDRDFMGFRALRVMNEDRVQPGQGFATHAHADMEILTWVLEGALAHRDSLGNGSIIRPGDAQRMSAGTGIRHSEFNASQEEPVHFLQIWILPDHKRLSPGYEQKHFSEAERQGRLCLVASPDGAEGSVTIHQDVRIYASVLEPRQAVAPKLAPDRHAWVQLARGELNIAGTHLKAGDGAAISNSGELVLEAQAPSEFLLFDLA